MAEAQPELLAQERDEVVTELRARQPIPKLSHGRQDQRPLAPIPTL